MPHSSSAVISRPHLPHVPTGSLCEMTPLIGIKRKGWWAHCAVTGCCPDWTTRSPASCVAVRWRKRVWSGRGRHWQMSRCHRLQIQRGRRRGGGLGEPSSSPESLLLVLPSSSHPRPPSPHHPLFPHLLPRLVVGAPFA